MSNYAVQDDKSFVETYSKEEIDAKVQDGSLIADGVIKSNHIFYNTIKNEHLTENSVEQFNIKDGAVTTEKLSKASVTSEKIADGSVYKFGSYIGTEESQNIEVGFRPSYIKIFGFGRSDEELALEYVNIKINIDVFADLKCCGVMEKTTDDGKTFEFVTSCGVRFTDTGFKFSSYQDINILGVPYYYIAYR